MTFRRYFQIVARYVDELGFWVSGEIAEINLKITTCKERFYMVLEHANTGVNDLQICGVHWWNY